MKINNIYISSKQQTKRDVVNTKGILVKLKLIIGAGTATMTPPLGPVLGQYGINIMEFCNEFNNETKDFEKGLALRVILWINVAKAFYFELQGPKVGVVLREFYKNEMQKKVEELAKLKMIENGISSDQEVAFEKMKLEVLSIPHRKIHIPKKKLLKDCFKIAVMLLSFNNNTIKTWKDVPQKLLQLKILEILGTCKSCHIYIAE